MTRTISNIPFRPTISDSRFEPELAVYTPPSRKSNYLHEKINRIRKAVYKRRPVLEKIMELYGNKSLFEFAKSYTRTNFAFANDERKQEFISVFRTEIARLLGEDVAKSAETQIARYYTVSTAEHNAPLTHTNYLNANLITSLPLLDPIDPNLQNIFVLSVANISFDNYALPRGLHVTTLKDGKVTPNQLVFFPRSVRPYPVVYHPAYTKDAIDEARKRIARWVREESINLQDAEQLVKLLDEVYGNKDVLNTTYYTEQITKTNFLLWKKLFSHSDTNVPNLVFLEQERIVNILLLTHHMNTTTPIGKLLFDPTYQKLFIKYFDTISNAFHVHKKAGTVYFWALPPGKKYREQLWYDNGTLVNDSGDYRLELTPQSVATALKNNELIPSTALSFILLSFYYGVRLRGAFEQTTYLTQMKQSYIDLLTEVNDQQSIAECINTPTTTLSFIRPILALASLPDGSTVPAGTIDVLLHGSEHAIFQMREMAKKITLDEAITRVLPLIYQRVYTEDERDPALQVSEAEIDKLLGLNKKLVATTILGE